MARPSKASILLRLEDIAGEIETFDALFNERAVLWDQGDKAGISLADLARASRCARAQVTKALSGDRVAKALAGQRRRRKAS